MPDATQVVAGVAVPMSTRRFPVGHNAHYVKPPTSSLDWAGADWEYPTALTFETETMRAKKIGLRVLASPEPDRADVVLAAINDMFRSAAYDAARLLADEHRVLDRDQPLTVRFDQEAQYWALRFSAITWPAIEGVTVPLRDRSW